MTKLYPSWFLFLSTNLLGMTLIVSSNNWMMIWMGFEISLLGFIPMTFPNKTAIEGMVKYMLVQATGSALYLMSMMMKTEMMSGIILMMSIMMKLGMFPLFQWVPSVMTSMNWTLCLILSTIQKVGPLMILMKNQMTMSNTNFIMICSSLGIMISGILGMNQTKMRPLMAYSSISHTSWMATSAILSTKVMMIYFMNYMFLTTLLFSKFKKMNTNSMISSKSKNMDMTPTMTLLIVLAGMPPFSVFYLKMIILMNLMMNTLIVMMMIVGAMFATYFYLTVVVPLTMTNYSKNNKLAMNPYMMMLLLPVPLMMFMMI